MAFNQMQGMAGLSGGMNPGISMGQSYKPKSGLSEFFTGNKGGFVQTPRYSQNQSQGIEQILQQALGMLNPKAIEQQATNRFNQQTVPGLAERFTSLGQARTSSPAFASQLGQAGAGMNVDLQALLSQLGQSLLPHGLTQQQDTHYQQGNEGFLSKILGQLLSSGGQAAGQYAGNMGMNNSLQQLLPLLAGL